MPEPTFDSVLEHFNEKLHSMDLPALRQMRARVASVFPHHLEISPVTDVLEVIDGLMALREIEHEDASAACARSDAPADERMI